MDIPYVEALPIPRPTNDVAVEAARSVDRQVEVRKIVQDSSATILDWLRHEFGLDKPGNALGQPHALDADGFAAAVRKALPRARKLSAADIARLKQEHRDTLEPAARAANEALALERKLSTQVNAAYGLTPEEVKLMWDTAPPRMPFSP